MMSKVLIISSSLRNACSHVDLFIDKLSVFLKKKCYVDVRSAYGLDISIINDYDTVVFAFSNAANMIPSSTLELFDDLNHVTNSSQNIYIMICNDEYETDKCDYSERVVEIFCDQYNFNYKGSLKIGSSFIIHHMQYGLVLTNRIKQFATAIIDNKDISISFTYSNINHFIKIANRYWHNVISKED